LELPLRYDLFAQSKNGFDWGHTGPAARQLAFSMLCHLGNEEVAKENAYKFANDVVRNFNSRDWILNASDVLTWIKDNTQTAENEQHVEKNVQLVKNVPENTLILETQKLTKKAKAKTNVVKDVCKELQITQKNLAQILEIPEGTVSSWAVKNEIPRLGKKAIEFYIQSQRNQQIIDSYKNFAKLLNVD
jgi:DNA-binding transcriptional regulator YiaG